MNPYQGITRVYTPDFDFIVALQGIGYKNMKKDVVRIETRNTVNDICGTWRVTVVPRDIETENLYDLIEPMNYVEIRFHRVNNEKTPVMRGFVSSVHKQVTMQDNKPIRTITITGENYGKIIKMAAVHYALGLDPPKVYAGGATEAPLWNSYGIQLQQGNVTPSKFVEQIFKDLVLPNFVSLKAFMLNRDKTSTNSDADKEKTNELVAQLIEDFSLDIDAAGVDGMRLPSGIDDPKTFLLTLKDQNIASAECAVVDLFNEYIGKPFNEMFVDDCPDKTYLVLRPFPYRDRDGKWVGHTAMSGNAPEYKAPVKRDIPHIVLPEEIISLELDRDDSEVYNYFFVDANGIFPGGEYQYINIERMQNQNPRFVVEPGANATYPSDAGASPTKLPLAKKLDYSRMEIYGFRKFWTTSKFMSYDPSSFGDAAYYEKIYGKGTDSKKASTDVSYITIGRQLNSILYNAFEHNSQLEKGTVVLKGREDIRPGMYIEMTDNRMDSDGHMYYVVDVSHDFVPFESFTTRLMLSRGEGHLDTIKKRPKKGAK